MSSAPPTRTQQVLIYFGLADDPSRKVARTDADGTERLVRRLDLWFTAIMPALLTSLVWEDRGAIAGLALIVLFAPAVAVAIAPGPLKQFREREPDAAELFAVPGIMLGGALYLVPNAQAIWIPIVIALAGTALVVWLGSRSSGD